MTLPRVAAIFMIPVIAASGCHGARAEPPAALPFHVAVQARLLPEPEVEGEFQDPETAFAMDSEVFEQELRNALEAQGVAKVSIVPAGALSGDVDAKTWALEAGADLLVDCSVRYRPHYEGARNDRFWLNLPLFLLVGPANLFVNDRTYTTQATLEGRLLDLQSSGAAANAAILNEQFTDVSMDFVERGGHKGVSMLYSLIVPAGFLATKSEKVAERMETAVAADLARQMADELRSSREQLVRGNGRYSFWMDVPEWQARREGNQFVVEGTVYLQPDGVVQMDRWQASAGSQKAAGEFGEGIEDGRRSEALGVYIEKHALRITLPADPSATVVHLELSERSSVGRKRTYTLPIGELQGLSQTPATRDSAAVDSASAPNKQ